MISSILNSSQSWFRLESLRPVDTLLEGTRKTAETAKKIFSVMGIASTLSSCIYLIVARNIPAATLGQMALVSASFFLLCFFFMTVQKTSSYFKDKIYQSNTFLNITQPTQLLMGHLSNLPLALQKHIENYRRACAHHFNAAQQQYKNVLLDENLSKSTERQDHRNEIQRHLYEEISPHFDTFHKELIKYAYPIHLSHAEKKGLEPLSRNYYKTSLFLAMEGMQDAAIISTINEIFADPENMVKEAHYRLTRDPRIRAQTRPLNVFLPPNNIKV